jgi:hypothetical protein
MMLEPGTDFDDMTPVANGFVRVHVTVYDSGGVRLTGYVPATEIGKVYKDRNANDSSFEQDVTLALGDLAGDRQGASYPAVLVRAILFLITITLPTDKSGPAPLPLWTTAEPSPG